MYLIAASYSGSLKSWIDCYPSAVTTVDDDLDEHWDSIEDFWAVPCSAQHCLLAER